MKRTTWKAINKRRERFAQKEEVTWKRIFEQYGMSELKEALSYAWLMGYESAKRDARKAAKP